MLNNMIKFHPYRITSIENVIAPLSKNIILRTTSLMSHVTHNHTFSQKYALYKNAKKTIFLGILL